MTSSSSPDVLVPREPTREMEVAGLQALSTWSSVSDIYRAMIAASPISLQSMQTTQGDGSLQPPASVPAPADGQVASQRQAWAPGDLETAAWARWKNNSARHANFRQAFRNGAYWSRQNTSPTDQSSDVSGLVVTESMREAFYGATEITREGTIRNFDDGLRAALAQAKRDGGAD